MSICARPWGQKGTGVHPHSGTRSKRVLTPARLGYALCHPLNSEGAQRGHTWHECREPAGMDEWGSILPLVDAAPDFWMARWGILLCNSRALLSPAGVGLDPKQAPRFPDTLQVGKRTHLKHMGLLEPQVPPKVKGLVLFSYHSRGCVPWGLC